MDSQEQLKSMEKKAILSTLWIFTLLNVIFRDIHELFREGMLLEVIEGVPVSDETLLIAGIVLEIPIAMLVLSRILPYRFNRWANIIIALLTIVLQISVGTNDLDDIWFLTVQVVALISIVRYAWTWSQSQGSFTTSLVQNT